MAALDEAALIVPVNQKSFYAITKPQNTNRDSMHMPGQRAMANKAALIVPVKPLNSGMNLAQRLAYGLLLAKNEQPHFQYPENQEPVN